MIKAFKVIEISHTIDFSGIIRNDIKMIKNPLYIKSIPSRKALKHTSNYLKEILSDADMQFKGKHIKDDTFIRYIQILFMPVGNRIKEEYETIRFQSVITNHFEALSDSDIINIFNKAFKRACKKYKNEYPNIDDPDMYIKLFSIIDVYAMDDESIKAFNNSEPVITPLSIDKLIFNKSILVLFKDI